MSKPPRDECEDELRQLSKALVTLKEKKAIPDLKLAIEKKDEILFAKILTESGIPSNLVAVLIDATFKRKSMMMWGFGP